MDGRYDKTLIDLCRLIAEARPVDVVKFVEEYFEDEKHAQVEVMRAVRCLRYFHTRGELFSEKVAALYTKVTQTAGTAQMHVQTFQQLLRQLGEHISIVKCDAVQQLLQQRYAESSPIGFKEARSCLWALILSQRVVWYLCHLLHTEEFTNCDRQAVLDGMRGDPNCVPSIQELQSHITQACETVKSDENQISRDQIVLAILNRTLAPAPVQDLPS